MNHHQCYFHKDKRILKFCALKQCTLPLCQICQPIHIQEHQDNNTKSEIISFLSAHSKAVSELQTLISDFPEKQSLSGNILKQKELMLAIIEKHYQEKMKGSNESVKLIDELSTKLGKIKKGSLKTLIMFFAQDPNSIRQKLKALISSASDEKFSQKQRDIRVKKFQSFFDNLHTNVNANMNANGIEVAQRIQKPVNKEIDDIIFASQRQEKITNQQRGSQVRQKYTREQKNREYDQRIYRQIKEELSKQRQNEFVRQRQNKNNKNNERSQSQSPYSKEKRRQIFKVSEKEINRETTATNSHEVQKLREKYEKYPSSHSKTKINQEKARKQISELSPIGRQSSSKKQQIQKHISFQMRDIRNNPGSANKYDAYQNYPNTSSHPSYPSQNENPYSKQLKTYEVQSSLIDKIPTYNNHSHHHSINSFNRVAVAPSPSQRQFLAKQSGPLTFQNRYKQSIEFKVDNSKGTTEGPSRTLFKMEDLVHNQNDYEIGRTKSYSQFSQGYSHHHNNGYSRQREREQFPLMQATNNANNMIPIVPIKINPPSKFDYEKLSKEVLSPQQIRKMLQKRIDQRKVLQTRLDYRQDRNQEKRNGLSILQNDHRRHVSSYPVFRNEEANEFMQRREVDTKNSIIDQIYGDSRY